MNHSRLTPWCLSATFLAMCLLCGADRTAEAGETISLDSAEAGSHWTSTTPRLVSVKNGELILDGRQQFCSAFYTPVQVVNPGVSAEFLVEPNPGGVEACGFILGAADSATFHFVHFDRSQAILGISTRESSWKEIRRVSGLEKPAGKWHQAAFESHGEQLRVSLNGKLLFEVPMQSHQGGRIGFYASEGLAHVKGISIQGGLQPTKDRFQLIPQNMVIVCKDAGAGAYEAFPDVCRLSDGRLMAVFYAGYGHISFPNEKLPKGGRICCCYSSDEGETWTAAEIVYDGPDDDRDPSIVQLPSGRILCNYFPYTKEGADGTWMISSDDLGKTWSAPRRIRKDAYCSSPIRILSTGRLILPLYVANKITATGAVMYSDDQGETWSDLIQIDNGGMRLDAETDVIELKAGTLYAALRDKMAYSISKDQGQTWSVAEPMGFRAHCPYFLRTVGGEIVIAYRIPATNLRVSVDECQTWGDDVEVDRVGGAYPSMVNLKDGSVLIVYYEEGPNSSIRAKRFRVTKTGVEFLPISQSFNQSFNPSP